MPISTFAPGLQNRYIPKSLPLQGGDYQLQVRHQNLARQKIITKRGNAIQVRSGNPGDNVDIRSGPQGVSFSRGAGLPTHLRQSGQQISIQKPTGQNTLIQKRGNTISVDRPGVSNDVQFTQTPSGLLIDRFGVQNDVRITASPNQVSFEYGQPLRNTSVTLTDGLEFDAVAYQEETTLHPHGLAILNDWFTNDSVDGADLITLTQKGEVLMADNLLR